MERVFVRWLGQCAGRLNRAREFSASVSGRDEFLQRLSHPFWFQSFGAVMGMDWHSSGITTSVIGALKRGLTPLQGELGIYFAAAAANIRAARLTN
jgi:hypothetical protein